MDDFGTTMEGCEACEAVATAELEHAQGTRGNGCTPLGDVRGDKRGKRARALPDLQAALVYLVHNIRALSCICCCSTCVCVKKKKEEEMKKKEKRQTERTGEFVCGAAAAACGTTHECEVCARDVDGAKLTTCRDGCGTRHCVFCAERHLHPAFLRSFFLFVFFPSFLSFSFFD